MTNRNDPNEKRAPEPVSEGVRIIGSVEARQVLDAGRAAGRRSDPPAGAPGVDEGTATVFPDDADPTGGQSVSPPGRAPRQARSEPARLQWAASGEPRPPRDPWAELAETGPDRGAGLEAFAYAGATGRDDELAADHDPVSADATTGSHVFPAWSPPAAVGRRAVRPAPFDDEPEPDGDGSWDDPVASVDLNEDDDVSDEPEPEDAEPSLATGPARSDPGAPSGSARRTGSRRSVRGRLGRLSAVRTRRSPIPTVPGTATTAPTTTAPTTTASMTTASTTASTITTTTAPPVDPRTVSGPSTAPPATGSSTGASHRGASRTESDSPARTAGRRSRRPGRGRGSSTGRHLADETVAPRPPDLRSRLVVGVALAILLIVAYAVGPKALVVLAAAVVLLCATEAFGMLQRCGFRPATLLGLAATGGLMFAAYWRGEPAVPLVVGLAFVGTMVWYLLGIVDARPLANVAVTSMTILWVGLLGSFAALLLRVPDGRGLFLGAVVVTVASDIVAYFGGRRWGRHALAPDISPGKTVEGLLAGAVAAVVVGAIIGEFVHPWGGIAHGLLLGAAVAIFAPIGDLFESLIKRDLEVKDSGTALAGHGGLLDRFDSVLVVLPVTYYLADYLHLLK